MTITSSYSNSRDDTPTNDDDLLVARKSRFRRTPVAAAFEASRDRIAECDRQRGHILKITDAGTGIACTECEAEWIDEGF